MLLGLQQRRLWSAVGRRQAAGSGRTDGLRMVTDSRRRVARRTEVRRAWLLLGLQLRRRFWFAVSRRQAAGSGRTDGLRTVTDSRWRVGRRTEARRAWLLLGLQQRRLWSAVGRRQAAGSGRTDGLRMVTDSRRRVARRTEARRARLLLGLQQRRLWSAVGRRQAVGSGRTDGLRAVPDGRRRADRLAGRAACRVVGPVVLVGVGVLLMIWATIFEASHLRQEFTLASRRGRRQLLRTAPGRLWLAVVLSISLVAVHTLLCFHSCSGSGRGATSTRCSSGAMPILLAVPSPRLAGSVCEPWARRCGLPTPAGLGPRCTSLRTRGGSSSLWRIASLPPTHPFSSLCRRRGSGCRGAAVGDELPA